jgi:hypothetical protein
MRKIDHTPSLVAISGIVAASFQAAISGVVGASGRFKAFLPCVKAQITRSDQHLWRRRPPTSKD